MLMGLSVSAGGVNSTECSPRACAPPRFSRRRHVSRRTGSNTRGDAREHETPGQSRGLLVRDTGIEPVTSSVSGKRATAAPIARFSRGRLAGTYPTEVYRGDDGSRTRVDGFAGRCLATRPRHRAMPRASGANPVHTRADDETRTRDPHLGKVMRYQLRHIRVAPDQAWLIQARGSD